jgi:excisionase family DNA binding protein
VATSTIAQTGFNFSKFSTAEHAFHTHAAANPKFTLKISKGVDSEMEKYNRVVIEKGHANLPLMTASETAQYMGVGKKIVYQLIEFGELNAVKNKGQVLIEKSSVDHFRSSGKLT